MIQLKTKNADISRIGKLLVRYEVKAKITDELIILEGNINDELLVSLLISINISAISNYESKSSTADCYRLTNVSERQEDENETYI